MFAIAILSSVTHGLVHSRVHQHVCGVQLETSDNLNLMQPVNPWVGNGWSQYIEYYQWVPEYNYDSSMHNVSPGDVLHGVLTYNANNNSYTITHTNMNDGWSVTSVIPIQKAKSGGYKQYTIMYVVFEKPANCDQYPPEGMSPSTPYIAETRVRAYVRQLINLCAGKVTFYDIAVEYNNQPVTMAWTTGYVDDVCNNRANVVNATTST